MHIYIEIAHEDDAALRADALAPTGELTALHVALHDVHAVLLIEGHARDLIEANDVVLADQTALPVRHVHKHPGDGRFPARDEMRVGRNLLEEMTLAGPSRPKLDHVVVPLD